jgi:hypothetical protein
VTTRTVALALGGVGLVAYAGLRIRSGTAVAPAVVGCLLGLVVLGLLARQR